MSEEDDREIGALFARRFKELETELLAAFGGPVSPDAVARARRVAQRLAEDEVVAFARRRREADRSEGGT